MVVRAVALETFGGGDERQHLDRLDRRENDPGGETGAGRRQDDAAKAAQWQGKARP